MKHLVIILFLSLSLSRFSHAGEPEEQIQIVRNFKELPAPVGEGLATKIVALLESCTVRLNQYNPTDQEWQDMLHSYSIVHLTFSPARQLKIESGGNLSREKTMVSEVLVTLRGGHSPGVYARTENGFYAFSKYFPGPVNELLADPALNLSSVNP